MAYLATSTQLIETPTAQKVKFSIKDIFSEYNQISRKLRIWSQLMKKSLTENFIFCTVSLGTGLKLNVHKL